MSYVPIASNCGSTALFPAPRMIDSGWAAAFKRLASHARFFLLLRASRIRPLSRFSRRLRRRLISL
jgi:hypothetical protein